MTTDKSSKSSPGGADQSGLDGQGKVRSRRGFLVGAGAAAGIAGAAAVALKSPGQPVVENVDPQPAGDVAGKSRGYHETAHIRKYYDTTKV